MATFDPLQPTSELDAVNTMLAALGQMPLATQVQLENSSAADVKMARDFLARASREVQSAGWRFNSLYGFELVPVDEYEWVDRAGRATTLNIFKRPPDILSWELTQCVENGDLDMIERPSLGYTEGGLSVPVLFDRTWNRDGAAKVRHPGLYIDAVFLMSFEHLPECARRYIAVRAARQFASQVLGAQEIVSYTQEDEMMALRALKLEQGLKEKLNVLYNSLHAYEWFGGRPYYSGGRMRRVHRGGT